MGSKASLKKRTEERVGQSCSWKGRLHPLNGDRSVRPSVSGFHSLACRAKPLNSGDGVKTETKMQQVCGKARRVSSYPMRTRPWRQD